MKCPFSRCRPASRRNLEIESSGSQTNRAPFADDRCRAHWLPCQLLKGVSASQTKLRSLGLVSLRPGPVLIRPSNKAAACADERGQWDNDLQQAERPRHEDDDRTPPGRESSHGVGTVCTCLYHQNRATGSSDMAGFQAVHSFSMFVGMTLSY